MGNLVINLSTITPNNNGELYKDIKAKLPTDFSPTVNTNAVKQSLNNIFTWRKGQRILNPAFGNIIYEYLYEPINGLTTKNLRAGILQMLSVEPRINVISMDINPVPDENSIYVAIQYLIPALNVIDTFNITVNIISV